MAKIVGVGTSGTKFARKIKPDAPSLDVATISFSRERERRQLAADSLELDYQPVLVDDLAVSGLTLAVASRAVRPEPSVVAVGMLYHSRTTWRRIRVSNIISAITYCRLGGGNPPINSLATLRTVPERLDALTEKYFASNEEFQQLIQGGEL